MREKQTLAAMLALLCSLFGCSILQAQDQSRPLPANTSPGIVEIQTVNGKVYFLSVELDGRAHFQTLQNLPLAKIKGNRTRAETIKFGCYPASIQTPCLVEANLDGEREIWFYRKGPEKPADTLIKLPNRTQSDLFWFAPFTSIAGDGPLNLVAPPEGTDLPAKIWVENKGQGPEFFAHSLPSPNQLVMARPSFKGDHLSGLFLVLSNIGEPYTAPAEGVEILGSDAAGVFTSYAVPPDCEVLGAINDTVICGANTRGKSHSSSKPVYPKIMRLQLPDGAQEDIVRNNQAPAFHAVGNSILVRGITNGISRPFIQSFGDEAMPALQGENTCIQPNENVDIFEVTASETAVLLKVSSPLTPTRFIMAPIDAGKIRICAEAAWLYRAEPSAKLDHSQFQMERLFLSGAKDVPITLISGANEGQLSGNTLLITYGVAGIRLPEEYLGPWLPEWVTKGGKIAFVHLPGGGGYGAQWTSQGFGIRGKLIASQILDQTSAKLVEMGLADHGKVSILTESGGGPLAAHAILRNPDRYAVFALRAGCFSIDGEKRENCANNYGYGNWSNLQDRHLMEQFELLERITASPDFPTIIYGLPETDDRVNLDFQRQSLNALAQKDIQVFPFRGANHTQRASADIEADWVKMVFAGALAAH